MKFRREIPCECGGNFPFSTFTDERWLTVVCSKCGKPAGQTDPRSVSVTTERLLLRSKVELEGGDYSLSILFGAIAVESFLIRLFVKVKSMDAHAKTSDSNAGAKKEAWENEYRRNSGGGGFAGPVDFVCRAAMGTTFDEFISRNAAAKKIVAGLPDTDNLSATQYFQRALFGPRNRIAHGREVKASQAEAEWCHILAVAIVSILREMDRFKYAAV